MREYLVSHGKSGGFGRFAAEALSAYRRGERVVIEGARGLEIGEVLCPVTDGHRKLLGGVPVRRLLRRADGDDQRRLLRSRESAQALFAAARRLARELSLPVEIIDAEVAFDGAGAVVQFLPVAECDLDAFAVALGSRLSLNISMENLALAPPEEEERHGCGKPNCGKTTGGGCDSCGSGGGCGSGCGSGGVELREYFAHLRTKMESYPQRTTLL
jgi:hypothetical protein